MIIHSMYSFLRWWIVSCEFSRVKFVDICRFVQGVGVVSLWRGPAVRKHLVYDMSNICQLCFNLGEWRHAILVSLYIHIIFICPRLGWRKIYRNPYESYFKGNLVTNGYHLASPGRPPLCEGSSLQWCDWPGSGILILWSWISWTSHYRDGKLMKR